MYLDWKVGDRVCCVIDGWGSNGYTLPCQLIRNKVYTIARFEKAWRMGIDGLWTKHLVVHLKEVRNPYNDAGFDARRFRKVQPRKTSIAIFEAMLHGNRSEVEA